MGFIPSQEIDDLFIPDTVFYDVPPEITYAIVRDTGIEWKAVGGNHTCKMALFLVAGAGTDVVSTSLVCSNVQNAYMYMHNVQYRCTQSYTYQNQTVYFGFGGNASSTDKDPGTAIVNPLNTEQLSNDMRKRIAWAMWFGSVQGFTITYDLVNCTGNPSNPTVIPPETDGTVCMFSRNPGYSFNSGSCWIDGTGEGGDSVQFDFNPYTGNLKIGIVESNITVHVHAFADPYGDINGEDPIPGADQIQVPNLPTVSATGSGIIGLFRPTNAQMNSLANYMWTNIPDTGATIETALNEITQALKRSISNPLDYIIGLNIIPSRGLTIGGSKEIKFGFTSSGVYMEQLGSQYFVVDCGHLTADATRKLCGDTFLDYAPYAKYSIYLPYIGVKDVDANDFVGHDIQVIYHGDVVTGGITAYILKDGSVMYQYSGCCALSIPLSSDGWGSTISGAVQIATSVVAGAVTGGAAGAALGAAKGAANVASNPSLLSPQVLRSGAVSGGAGCMGVQTPFIIREAVSFHDTKHFNTVTGYPSYYYKTLNQVHGFTTCFDVHLHNIPGTREEVDEIEKLLKEGVIL